MGELARTVDWSATPIGPTESWPQSLRTAVSICLASRFPQLIWWGPELIQIYNDGYRPVLGGKHPRAMGQRGDECWAEIWDVVGPMYRQVCETGRSTWSEDLLLVMDRYGFTEETYFTFSYSAIRDEGGRIAGVLVTCVETTERVVGERRLDTLRSLAAQAVEARTPGDACRAAALTLGAASRDVPFALIYLLDRDGSTATLAATAGVEPGSPAAPERVDLSDADGDGLWGLGRVATSGERAVVDGLADRRPGLHSLPRGDPADRAVVLPVARPGQARPAAVLVAGVSPALELDDAYTTFLELAAGSLATAIANAEAYEAERKRAESLAELDRAKTTFFSNISHEFRTPLTLLLAPLEDLLAELGEQPHHRQRLEAMKRNTLRLQKLVNTLLDFSRIEAGRVRGRYEPTDLAPRTAELASMFQTAADRAGIELRVETEALPHPVHVDRDMWEKIVLNLLSNALKYTFEGTITVRLAAAGDRAELSVEDTGTGIPEAELPHLFERFRRVEGARARTVEGSGIGLALVKELVALHGGSVEAESRLGEGSTFRVSIPFGTEHLPASPEGSGAGASVTALGPAPYVEEALRWVADDESSEGSPEVGGDLVAAPGRIPVGEEGPGAHVLVADDNADMRDYLRRILRSSWTVTAVADGETALAEARAHHPDLIVADVMMPGLDGFELLAALRADPATREMPVILLSARAGEESRIEGMQAGADDYLVKPFSARELLARVGAHIEMARIRRQAAAALRESEQRFRNMAEHAPVMIWVTESDGRCSFLNSRWYDFTGQTPEEALGFGWLEAVHPDDRDRARAAFLSAHQDGRSFRLEYRLRRADGEYRWTIDAAAPRRDQDGTLKGYIGSVIDITDRKRTEEERERLLLREQEARQAAEEANRAKAQFLATMSHELRTPLNAIMGFVDLLEAEVSGSLNDAQQHQLSRIDGAARHLLQIIEEILSFSRVEAGREELHIERADLADVVRETAGFIEPLARSRSLDFRVRLPDGPTRVTTDPGKVRQILLNLLSNAVKFTDRGTVELQLEPGESDFTLRVRDTGRGIPPGDVDQIFEAFRQIDRSRTSSRSGTGLGLTVSRQLAHLLGGELTVDSRPGEGSTFTFVMPRESRGPVSSRTDGPD